MKQLSKKQVINQGVLENIELERIIMAESECPFIASLKMAFQDPYNVYIVTEVAEGGDTFSLVETGSSKFYEFKKTKEEGIRFMAASIILGLEYLHGRNIIYRDLKLENVLLFADGYIKLTDFGLSTRLTEGKKSTEFVGTPTYYAPEMWKKEQYGLEIDLWSLGVYLYEIAVYLPPFSDKY